MIETIKNAWRVKEIRIKILITIGLVLLYRLGAFIPVAGIDVTAFGVFGDTTANNGMDFMNIMNSVVGGALANGTLFAMGITPYINASIILQLLTVAIPRLERLSKQGEDGRKKITQYTRYATVILAIVQSVGILLSYSGTVDTSILGLGAGWDFVTYILVVLQFAAGTALAMWIGERITDYGVGNGISLLIFAGILATAGNSIMKTSQGIFAGSSTDLWSLIAFVVLIVVIFGLIVWVDLAERRIPVQYAKQVKGRKMYGGQSTNIPIRINASGVLPLIFAFALLSFPSLIISMFHIEGGVALWFVQNLSPGGWVYTVLVSLLILFFAFFYAQIQFNPDDISRNIQQYGGFIPGIRPGKPTTDYLKKISNRITLFGAIFLALIALVPSLILGLAIPAGNSLLTAVSTTGMLIVVSVALEFDQQLESQIMMRHYKGFLD